MVQIAFGHNIHRPHSYSLFISSFVLLVLIGSVQCIPAIEKRILIFNHNSEAIKHLRHVKDAADLPFLAKLEEHYLHYVKTNQGKVNEKLERKFCNYLQTHADKLEVKTLKLLLEGVYEQTTFPIMAGASDAITSFILNSPRGVLNMMNHQDQTLHFGAYVLKHAERTVLPEVDLQKGTLNASKEFFLPISWNAIAKNPSVANAWPKIMLDVIQQHWKEISVDSWIWILANRHKIEGFWPTMSNLIGENSEYFLAPSGIQKRKLFGGLLYYSDTEGHFGQYCTEKLRSNSFSQKFLIGVKRIMKHYSFALSVQSWEALLNDPGNVHFDPQEIAMDFVLSVNICAYFNKRLEKWKALYRIPSFQNAFRRYFSYTFAARGMYFINRAWKWIWDHQGDIDFFDVAFTVLIKKNAFMFQDFAWDNAFMFALKNRDLACFALHTQTKPIHQGSVLIPRSIFSISQGRFTCEFSSELAQKRVMSTIESFKASVKSHIPNIDI